jgi:cell division protein FtsB
MTSRKGGTGPGSHFARPQPVDELRRTLAGRNAARYLERTGVSAYARASARAARRPNIRWDRLGRVALLGVLFVILTMYASPLQRWLTQSKTAKEDTAELHRLEAHNRSLKARLAELGRPQALELRARKLGMVKQGERSYVIENLPR